MRNISDKNCRENQNIHFVLNNFYPEKRGFYELTCKYMAEPEKPHIAIMRMRFSC